MTSEPASHVTARYRRKAVPAAVWQRILRREQGRLYRRFARAFPPRPDWRVLDLGVSADHARREDYLFESRFPHLSQVVAGGLEDPASFEGCFPEARYVQLRRGEPLPFEDGAFDVVFCNAVVEHVGSRAAQRAFVAEVFRVGRNVFLTTPNRWYPVELHTVVPLLHYLPPAIHRPVYRRLGFDFFAEEENLNLLDRRGLRRLLPTGVRARIGSHWFAGLPSNLVLTAGPDAP